MAGEKLQKVKDALQKNALIIIGVLAAAVAYLVIRMKKKRVKLFGR